MDKISRYLFILISIILFLVVAPLIVLYVSGTSLDFGKRDYTPTGILTAETRPQDALLTVEGRQPEQTPATIRFLPQGEYNVKLTKDGYFDWSKRLLVEPSRVTYAHEGVDAVHLIKKPLPVIIANKGVTTAAMVDDTLWYAVKNSAVKVSIGNIDKPETISLPFTPRSLAALRNSSYLIAEDEAGRKALIHRSTNTVSILPDSFKTAADFTVDTNGQLLARQGTQIVLYNLQTKSLQQKLSNVTGFTMIGATAYIAHQRNDSTTLQAADWNGTEFTNTEPLLASPLPNANNIRIIITERKELFILANEVFYRVNAQLDAISTHVIAADLDYSTNELVFRTPSELWFYNFIRNAPQLLTRNTSITHAFAIRGQIGYGFIGTNSGLDMLEIDTRDGQNRYALLTGKPVWAVGISSNLKTVWAIEEDKLVMISIQ